jgi:hypothetical protein
LFDERVFRGSQIGPHLPEVMAPVHALRPQVAEVARVADPIISFSLPCYFSIVKMLFVGDLVFVRCIYIGSMA